MGGSHENSIQMLSPVYNTDRMVQDYTNQYYVPSSERFGRFNTQDAELALRFADYKANQERKKVTSAIVNLGSIPINQVKVEVIYYQDGKRYM